MENLDGSESNAKERNEMVSDSAYATSCSNSQSRRSHSSKSTHSGHSSGSSGYHGNQSSKGASNHLNQPAEKWAEDKKQPETELQADEFRLPEPAPITEVKKEVLNAIPSPTILPQAEIDIQNMDATTDMKQCEDTETNETPQPTMQVDMSRPSSSTETNETPQPTMQVDMSRPSSSDGFSCVISMHDGVVIYATSSLTTTLGFPKDMWIGRSFIDFVHPLDHNTFASQITSGLRCPKKVNGVQDTVQLPSNSVSLMFCRIRRYRGLSSGFGVKDITVKYIPLMLKLTFKNIYHENRLDIYLVIQASLLLSAFKTAHEVVVKPVPFLMRHVSNGILEYVDHDSVPFLGYLPQDITGKNVLHLYHPEDLVYVRQIYQTIVKEGVAPRTRPYRMMAQNGQYLKVETEWSSFVNPWSRKLEFVVGKHHVMEGPANPDVFLPPDIEDIDEDKNKSQRLRESILRIMNEVLTKPAEFAKQQMTKRCQDVASFMESLMEEEPKEQDELRLEIQEPDNSCFERDSVMLGGISPHHDYDSKSSTATSLSYNQLNYKENLQRYFDSHQQTLYEEYQLNTGENRGPMTAQKRFSGGLPSPMAQHFGDSVELPSSGELAGHAVGDCGHVKSTRDNQALRLPESLLNKGFSSSMAQHFGDSVELPSSGELAGHAFGDCGHIKSTRDYQALRLTESLLNKHNSEMEKSLVMQHRDSRASSKECRDKASSEIKQKKKDHLARCNAYFMPTVADSTIAKAQPHGLKRPSRQFEVEASSHKHHCAAPLSTRRRPLPSANFTSPYHDPTSAPQWQRSSASPVASRYSGIPQEQVSLINPMGTVSGLIPMYYVPSPAPTMPSNPAMTSNDPKSSIHFQPSPIHYMMYGQAVIGSPVVVSPISPQVEYHSVMSQFPSAQNSLGLTTSNYEEACKPANLLAASQWRDKLRTIESLDQSSNVNLRSGVSSIYSASKALSRSTEVVTESSNSRYTHLKMNQIGNNEDIVDRTDGESSYFSFYSSFFKTESGSAEDSGDATKGRGHSGDSIKAELLGKDCTRGKVMRRKRDPPWMDQVCVTSKLIYKYQLATKNMDEVLSADKQKLALLQQPSLVNEQLGKLYMDMELEGVAGRLTLEEGITSSSNSGEENSRKCLKAVSVKRLRRRRDHNKVWMVYEEDTPLPSPEEAQEFEPSTSLS